MKNLPLIKYYLFFLGYLSLVIGFYLNENSSGGAQPDFQHHLLAVNEFKNNFKESILNYSQFKTDHSPLYITFLTFLSKITSNNDQMRFLYLTLFSTLPLVFLACLKKRYSSVDEKTLIILSCVIFLSPNVRSLLIWPGSEIVSLFFLLFSIYFFQIFKEKKKLKFIILNIFFLSLSAYMRPIYSIFSIYFFWFYFKEFKFSKFIFIIIFTNIFLSLPAFYYIFFIDDFLFISIENQNYSFSNKIFIISSILCFHFLPFYFFFFKRKFFNNNYFILSVLFIFLLTLTFFFDFEVQKIGEGGGFFLKISNLLFGNNILFFFSSFVFIIFLFSLKETYKIENFLLILILFLLVPHTYYYHEYYDPLFLFLIFTLFKIDINSTYFQNKNNLKFMYSFYVLFYFVSVIKNLNFINNNIIN